MIIRVVLGGILTVSLLAACIMDIRKQLVYNFVWWSGGLAAGGLLWQYLENSISTQPSAVLWELLVELSLFLFIQLFWFDRFYGKADCYGFCVCAVAEASLGKGLYAYLVLMLASLLLLFCVQLTRGNMNKKGNLKQPVAFLPYIVCAFGMMMYIYTYKG